MNEIKTTDQSIETSSWYLKLHRRLLPNDPEVGVMPYIWLFYLLMYFFQFFFVDFTVKQYIYSLIGIPLFLILYFRTFWVSDKHLYFYIAAIWGIGFMLALQKIPGASVFTVYAAAFTAQFSLAKKSFTTLGLLLGLHAAIYVAFDISLYITIPALFFATIIGASNIFMTEMAKKNRQIKASQDEIKKIATSAERERIARDLHDLIGHTFSVINIKSQLAQKLVLKDVAKAAQEIKEIEKISRTSLSQVREVVSDYRKRDLATELSQARILLDSLDVQVTEKITSLEQLNLSNEQNTALAYIVRELTTNIMRHSQATTCEIELNTENQHTVLRITDNGIAQSFKAGSGLNGIRERTEQLGGQVNFLTDQGFIATIQLPAA